MGRAKRTSIPLQDLRTIFDHQRFEAALSRLRENAADAIHIVESLRLQDLKTGERSELGGRSTRTENVVSIQVTSRMPLTLSKSLRILRRGR
jgi:hypothetical protein